MKKHLISAVLLTVGFVLILMVLYPLSIWGIAQAAPNSGKGIVIPGTDVKNYYLNIGQSFTESEYFWGRPSAINYNASGSGASNKGANNKEYLEEVTNRLNVFLEKNPGVKRNEVPVDLLTASGSGLDPHISVQAALVQAARISKARKIKEEQIKQLIKDQTEQPFMGIFGPEKINVVMLNIALDKMIAE